MRDYATWELRNIIKALSFLPLLNTPEENARLKAAKAELKKREKTHRYLS